MNTGVEILLKRMETHPEDFYYQPHKGGMGRWMRLVDHAVGEEVLTLEEHEAIKAGLKEVKRQRFTELVMKELAGVDEEDDTPAIRVATMNSHGQVTFPTMLDAQSYQKEMMKKMLEEYVRDGKDKAKAPRP